MKVIVNEMPKWVLVYSPKSLTPTMESILKELHNVRYITVILKEYPKQ